MFNRLIEYWKSSPKFRFGARQVGAAVVGYAVPILYSGNPFDWRNLVSGAATAGGTALLGVLGLEPFVGFNKPDHVEVPSPPAVKETP